MMMTALWALVRRSPATSALAVLLALSLLVIGWLDLSRALLRADLAGARSELAAIEAGRDAYRQQAEAEAVRLVARERGRADNFRRAREGFEHAKTDAAVSDRDRAVLDCLHQLRAGQACSTPR